MSSFTRLFNKDVSKNHRQKANLTVASDTSKISECLSLTKVSTNSYLMVNNLCFPGFFFFFFEQFDSLLSFLCLVPKSKFFFFSANGFSKVNTIVRQATLGISI